MHAGLPKHAAGLSTTLGRAVTFLIVLMLIVPTLAVVATDGDSPTDNGSTRAAAGANEWLTFKGDDQRTGVAVSEAPSVDKVLWEIQYKGSVIYSSPTVWNQTVYIGVSGSIKAIWAKNGTERWTYIAPNPVHTSPVISDGIIYAGANDYMGTSAVAVDALTGQEIWNASIPDFVTSAPLVLGNSVYFGSQNHILYCLKKADGVQRWNFTAENDILYGSIAESGGLLYFGIAADSSNNGKALAVNAITGAEEWNRSVVGSVWSSPSVADGLVLFSTAGDKSVVFEPRNGYVYAFNLTSGAQKWRSPNLGMVMASPSIKNGHIYVGTFGKFLNNQEIISPQMYCLDLSDGEIIWSELVNHEEGNSKVWSSVTISGSKIIFGDELGYLNVWNINGLRIWDHAMREGAAVKTTPAVAGEMIFAANTMGDVFGFGSQPDMAVNSSSIDLEDEYPHLGQRVNVRARISNIGDKTATANVYIYNGTLDDWNRVINSTTITLEPGRSTFVYAVWIADEIGNRAVWVRILDVVPNEDIETNNEALRVLEVQPPATGWLTARANTTGVGFINTSSPGNNLTKWLRAEGSDPGPGLVATMDMVYFPVGQRLVALDRLIGTVEWTHDLASTATTSPGIGDGGVFVGTDAGTLIAMDLEVGNVRFTRQLDGRVSAGPTVSGTMVLVGTDKGVGGGTLYALDTFDGSDLWVRDMSAPVKAHPAVDGAVVYALSDNGAVLALNASDGALRWQYPVGNAPGSSLTSSPLVAEERLYVASTSGFIYCLDADPIDGEDEGKPDPDGSEYDVIWTYKEENLLPFNSSPAMVDGKLVLLTGEHDVLALDAINGTIAWRISMPGVGPLTMDLIAVNNSIVVGGQGIHIITADAGVETWTYEGSTSAFVSGPIALDDMLFVTDERGILFAFGKVENQPPIARISFPVGDSQFRINETITFDGSNSTDDKELLDTSFMWEFGDGNVSLARIATHGYINPGTYIIRLTVTDTDGEIDNTSVSIRILGNHEPILDLIDVEPEQGHTQSYPFNFSVRYTDPDNDPPEYVKLLLSDEPGYTPVNMKPVDPNDNDYTDGKNYFIIQAPLASRPYPAVTFSASDGIAETERVVKGPVVMMDGTFPNSVGDIEVFAVFVGPNELDYIPVTSPPSTYPPGLYPIGVFVELNLDTTFMLGANISINYTIHNIEDIDLDTLAVYKWSASGVDAGYEYIEASIVDTSTGIVSAPIPSLQHDIYTVLGNRLNPPPNHDPVPLITVDGKTYNPGAKVSMTYRPDDVIAFDGGESYDPDEDDLNDFITFYGWSFGDGTTFDGETIEHSYDVPNKYTVTLTVRDNFGGENSVIVIINVRAEGESTFLYLLVSVCIIVILILVFFPKGGGTKPATAKVESKEPRPLKDTVDNGKRVENGAKVAEIEELDDIIDELEEDRSQ